MELAELSPEGEQALEQVLGYLNFSSGAADPQLLASLNRLYGILSAGNAPQPLWRQVAALLRAKLDQLRAESPAFRDAEQAAHALQLLTEHVLPDYLAFHRDLLFHQTESDVYNPLFFGRVCEAVLRQGGPWTEVERITAGTLATLNDYIGHRPVAVLESQKIEPYAHEWVRPVPLYVQNVGVAEGRYQEVVSAALTLLEQTDENILRAAYFDPKQLNELAFDPRAYDFEHPVSKRPNYHFGQWDPHQLDGRGRYDRFVVQQVTLDALLTRLDEPTETPRDELLFEAAAVLAGTILMAAGVSGSGPDTHDSTVTLSNLLPRIAAYRDAFYQQLLQRSQGPLGERLRAEAVERRQAFGGARQHLNTQLAQLRALQLEHVHLAKIFARMGYFEPAKQQADVVPVASARMMCRIDCRLTAGYQAVERGDIEAAAAYPADIVDLLRRGIQCGAIIDPWNLLGFDANFSLFPALENSVHDHRADDLVALLEQIFAFYARVWSEAAAVDKGELCRQIRREFQELAEWWRQFAAHEVSSVDASDPLDVFRAAEHVAEALNLWHKGGASTGDLAFWAPHADMFDSPKAYALVVEAMLERGDFVAAMALLVHWISQADRVALEQGDSSFSRLTERWLLQLLQSADAADAQGETPEASSAAERAGPTWELQRKFFDFLEANADEYWQVPSFELGTPSAASAGDDAMLTAGGEDQEDEEDLFGAAYEDMVYRDSTDDGVEGEVHEAGYGSDDELVLESDRIADRLLFLGCVARLWKLSAVTRPRLDRLEAEDGGENATDAERRAALGRWGRQAVANQILLMKLLAAVRRHRLPAPTGDHDSMLEYDRRRLIKDSLLERIISVTVETADAARLLLAAASPPDGSEMPDELDEESRRMIAVLNAVLEGSPERVREHWQAMADMLSEKPLLYVPLSKGGTPRDIVAARVRQQSIQDLLEWLPRLGLVLETCQLIEIAREMERNNPVGPGAVTEFDELFKIGYRAMVESLVASAQRWQPSARDESVDSAQAALVAALEQLTESLLVSWLSHSRTLRLSVLERAEDRRTWKRLVGFIEKYGGELFTQHFLNLGNLRAILHRGVDNWLEQLQKAPAAGLELPLLEDFDDKLSREEAAELLTIVLEAIVENYGEYRDYNSTTTQSDHGELLYTLLDFLRLRTRYDRICWNLRPVVLAHEILVRHGQEEAAQLWRQALTDRISDEADRYLERLATLQSKYAMRLPTVADRLAERFIQPLVIDRVRALVKPAIEEAMRPEPHDAFELLASEIDSLASKPTGAGLDVPNWLLALEDEVERARQAVCEKIDASQISAMLPSVSMTLEETQQQLDEWVTEDD